MSKNLPAVAEKPVAHGERSHAPLSPSGAERWMECAASYKLTKDLPDFAPNKYIIFGEECHEWGERALRVALEGKSYDPILRKCEDPKMREIARSWVEMCMKLVSQIRKICDKAIKTFVEHRVYLTKNIWGTLDFGIIFHKGGKDYIIVADLKTGTGVKKSAKDPQLNVYALGLAELTKNPIGGYYKYIHQLAFYEEFDRDKVIDLSDFQEKLFDREEACLEAASRDLKSSDYKPGSWCKFCKVVRRCPAVKRDKKRESLNILEEIDDGSVPAPKHSNRRAKPKAKAVRSRGKVSTRKKHKSRKR